MHVRGCLRPSSSLSRLFWPPLFAHSTLIRTRNSDNGIAAGSTATGAPSASPVSYVVAQPAYVSTRWQGRRTGSQEPRFLAIPAQFAQRPITSDTNAQRSRQELTEARFGVCLAPSEQVPDPALHFLPTEIKTTGRLPLTRACGPRAPHPKPIPTAPTPCPDATSADVCVCVRGEGAADDTRGAGGRGVMHV